jgi:type VI secretion system Hcp family effector
MPTAVERIAPTKWSLAGSVMIGPFEQSLSWLTFQMNLPQLRRTGRSLKVIRRFGPVSSQIRDAMLKKTILPKVEIETPYYTVTLVNAQIAKIRSYHPPATGTHSESRDTYEQEELSFSFQKIEFTWTGGGTTAQDDWNAQS